MATYAKTDGTSILEFRNFENVDGHLTPAEAQAAGKPYWLPYIVAPRPVHDGATHLAAVRDDDVIYADRVEQTWLAPVAKTQAQIDAEVTATQDRQLAKIDRENSVDKALAVALFTAINEIRVLKGDGTLSSQQFKDYLRGLM